MPSFLMSQIRRHGCVGPVSFVLTLVVWAPLATAQPATRAEEYTQAQEKKAISPVGPLQTRAERIAKVLQSLGTPPIGFFPFFGNIYPSSWVALGPAYRRPFNSGAAIMAKGAWSVRNFKTADVQIHSPRFASDRLSEIGRAHV